MPEKVTEDKIQKFVNDARPSLVKYAVRNYKEQEFLRSALLCISESKDLKDCLNTNEGKASLYHALKYASSTGLSLNPQEGKAALIPYSGKVTYQIMKGGMVELALESPLVESLDADVVYENDDWQIIKKSGRDEYNHVPARKDRGKVDGYYAVLEMKNGKTKIAYMTVEEVQEHHKRYGREKKNKEKDPWVHSFDGMAIKTVIKKLLRNLHLSPATSSAVAIDDRYEVGELVDMTPEDITGGYAPGDVQAEMNGKDQPPEIEEGMGQERGPKTGDWY